MEGDIYEKYTTEVMFRRGEFISGVVLLDKMIEYYISSHLCSSESKRIEFMELIFGTGQIIYEKKRQIFKILIEKHNGKFLESNAKIFKDLSKIGEIRNILAHFIINASEDSLQDYKNGVFTFVEYSKSIKFQKITRQALIDNLKLISTYTTKIRELFEAQK